MSDYDDLVFGEDDIVSLLIPIQLKPKKRVVRGELLFVDAPVRLGQSQHVNNLNQMRQLLGQGYKVVVSFPVELERQQYNYLVLYRAKS